MERRELLTSGSIVAASLGVAGFAMFGLADYKIVDAEAQSNLLGPTEFEITIQNTGGSFGKVEVIVKAQNGDTILEETSKVVSVPSGKSQRFTLKMDVPEEADSIQPDIDPQLF